MLQFSLLRSDNIAVVDNADTTVDLSALPTNVEIIAFQAIEGKIEYNDRASVRTPFTDPSPYQLQLNLWITATSALTLAQAKQVKKDLVDSIFHHKRRLPYTYGPWQYDGRDEAVTYGTALLNGFSNAGVINPINAALSTITLQINDNVVAVNNSSANGFGVAVTTNCLNQCEASPRTFFRVPYPDRAVILVTVIQNGTPNFSVPNMVEMANLAGATLGAGNIPVGFSGNITMVPLNATTPQTIPADSLYQALLGIAQRRNTLNNNRMAKLTAIDNLTTVAAVTAYDATTGWSF